MPVDSKFRCISIISVVFSLRNEYGTMISYDRTVELGIEDAFGKLSGELKKDGYVLLSFVDVKEILTKNFGGERPGYYILNVCKPPAARDLLGENEDYGLFIPCKIVLIEKDGKTKAMMMLVSELGRKYLGSDGKKAEEYEKELISVIDRL